MIKNNTFYDDNLSGFTMGVVKSGREVNRRQAWASVGKRWLRTAGEGTGANPLEIGCKSVGNQLVGQVRGCLFAASGLFTFQSV